MVKSPSLESISLSYPLEPNFVKEPNHSSRCRLKTGLENVEREERERQMGDTRSQNLQTAQPHKSMHKTTQGCGKPNLDDIDLITARKSCSHPKPTITFTSNEEEEEDAVMAESEMPKVTTPIGRTRYTRVRHCVHFFCISSFF